MWQRTTAAAAAVLCIAICMTAGVSAHSWGHVDTEFGSLQGAGASAGHYAALDTVGVTLQTDSTMQQMQPGMQDPTTGTVPGPATPTTLISGAPTLTPQPTDPGTQAPTTATVPGPATPTTLISGAPTLTLQPTNPGTQGGTTGTVQSADPTTMQQAMQPTVPTQTPAATTLPTTMIVLGDSLSDNGNYFNLTGGLFPQPNLYFEGRFSNNFTYPEVAAQALNMHLVDLAFGTATACSAYAAPRLINGTNVTAPSLDGQIDILESQFASEDFAHSVAVVFVGANDLFSIFSLPPAQIYQTLGCRQIMLPLCPAPKLDAISACISAGVARLVQLGVGQIVLVALPAIDGAPVNAGLTAAQKQQVAGVVADHNAELATLPASFSNATISVLDLFGPVTKQAAAAVGVTDFTHSCITDANGNAASPANAVAVCPDPNSHFFFDSLHPSGVVHQLLANVLIHALTGV